MPTLLASCHIWNPKTRIESAISLLSAWHDCHIFQLQSLSLSLSLTVSLPYQIDIKLVFPSFNIKFLLWDLYTNLPIIKFLKKLYFVFSDLCSLYEACKVERRQFNHGLKCIPERVLPLSVEKQAGFIKLPGHLWRPSRASALMSSNISCIQVCRADNAMQHVLYPKHLLLL